MDLNTDTLTPDQLDYLEAFDRTFAPQRMMPGTCERCVWGRGHHTAGCEAPWFCTWCQAPVNAPDAEGWITCQQCGTHGGTQDRPPKPQHIDELDRIFGNRLDGLKKPLSMTKQPRRRR